VDSHLSFSQHIEKITCKAHKRANLIHRCFASRQRDLLIKSFITYARPILEYNSPLWSPTLKKDIIFIESVQRKFTKRISGMSGLSYHSRLKALNLESLELRRLRADLLLAYKILFGLLRVNIDYVSLQETSHNYEVTHMLHKQRCFSSNRRIFFSVRIVSMWNSLPAETTDFSGLDQFNNSVSNMFLLKFC